MYCHLQVAAMSVCLIVILSFAGIAHAQEQPILVTPLPQLNLTDQYTFNYTIPSNTFQDHADGNTRSLNLFLLRTDGTPVPTDSWINLQESTQSIIGYLTANVYNNQPASGFYAFRILALDADGHSADVVLVVRLLTPHVRGHYIVNYELASFNPLVVNSLKHVELLMIIHNRMATFHGLQEAAFVPDHFVYTKAPGEASIAYNFSTTSFLGAECNLPAIVAFRTKLLHGVGREDIFNPLMSIIRTREYFVGPCSGITADKPVIGEAITDFHATVGRPFTWAIPVTAFTLPAGVTMTLSLQLFFANGTAVPEFYWVSLNRMTLSVTSAAVGYIGLEDIRGRQTIDFQLRASTPLDERATQSIRLVVDGSVPSYSFTCSLSIQGALQASYRNVTISLGQMLSQFLGVAIDTIGFVRLRSNALSSSISWTFLDLATTTCDNVKLSSLTRRMTTDRVTVSSEFQQRLQAIGLTATAIQIEATDKCDVPFIQTPLPSSFNLTFGTTQMYNIGTEVFLDPTDGGNLQLSFRQNGVAVSQDSWISLDPQNRVLYMSPMTELTAGRSTHVFQLRATDSGGAFIEEDIVVNILNDVPSWNFRFQAIDSSARIPIAQYAYGFQQKLTSYYSDSVTSYAVLNRVRYSSVLGYQVYWTNSTFQLDECSYSSIYDVYIRLYNAASRVVDAAFKTAMEPDFAITQVLDEHIGACASWGSRPPQLNVQLFLALETTRSVGYCSINQMTLPVKLFEDEVDGDLNTLTQYLTYTNATQVPVQSWVGLDTVQHIIYAVPNNLAWSQRPANSEFVIDFNAEDSTQRKGQVRLRYSLSGAYPSQYYSITLTLKVFGMANEGHAVQTGRIFDGLLQAIGIQAIKSLYPRSYAVVSRTGNDGTATLVCGVCGMEADRCDQNMIEAARDVFLVPNTNDLRTGASAVIADLFQITQAEEGFSGPCFNNPPTVVRQIPALSIGLCGLLKYAVPEDAFQDSEDGTTRQLKLSVTTADGQTLSRSSWLQFSETTQTITGLLNNNINIPQLPSIASFLLTATDNRGKTAQQTIRISIDKTITTPSYRMTLSLEALQQSQNYFHLIATKIGQFMGDGGAGFHAVSVEETGSQVTMVWSNCSIQWDPCNFNQYYSFRSALKTTDGSWRQAFTDIFGPEFRVLTMTDSITGPCGSDAPPVVTTPMDDVILDVCRTHVIPIPENTFQDTEDGNTRALSLQLLKNNNQPLERYDWISFDQSKQEIVAIPMRSMLSMSASELRFVLQATDLLGQTVQTSLQFVVTAGAGTPSHTIRMTYKLKGVTAATKFTDIYKDLRRDLVAHLGQESWSRMIEYQQLPVVIDTVTELSCEFRNCFLDNTRCDNASISSFMSSFQDSNGAPKASLISALANTFDISSVVSVLSGVCKPEAPVVMNPIPTLNVGYCGFLEYVIPSNTFHDSVDGSTRNLTLSLLNSVGNLFTIDILATLSTATQTLTVVLNNELWSANNIPDVLLFFVKATNQRGLSVSTELRLAIDRTGLQYSYYYNTNLLIRGANAGSMPNNIVAANFMNATEKYLSGLESPNSIHIIKLNRALPQMITLEWTTCKLRYEPCDRAMIRELDANLTSQLGAHPEYTAALSDLFTILIFQGITFGPCHVANLLPKITKLVPDQRVEACSTFKTDSLKNYFRDEEDASDLDFRITQINGRPRPAKSWICVNHLTQEINAAVTLDVVQNQQFSGYNITVRATDKAGGFVESYFMVTFSTDIAPQLFYQVKLSLTTTDISNHEFQSIYDTRDIITSINSFYGTNATNVVSYERTGSQATVTWSYCGLPNQCDNQLANQHFARLVSATGVVDVQFANTLGPKFTVASLETIRDPICDDDMNPPTPTVDEWSWEMSYCGGFQRQVPEDMFTDAEEGNTRSLTLYLRTSSRTRLSQTSWIQFNQQTQQAYGLATRTEAIAHNSANTRYILVARDKTGLEGQLNVKITFSIPQEPKYLFTFSYSKTFPTKDLPVEEKTMFMTQVVNFFGDATSASFGLISYQFKSGDERETTFCNCSVSYNPCDLAQLRQIKAKMLGSDNLPTTAFNDGLRSPFIVTFGYSTVLAPCGISTYPPIVRNPLGTLNITLCSYFSYQVPADVFYDYDQGDTRTLALSLFRTTSNTPFGLNEWMSLDAVSQTITAVATVEAIEQQPALGFPITLVATDNTQLTAHDDFKAVMIGPTQVLKECSFLTRLKSTQSLDSRSVVELLQTFTTSLASYFQITREEIAVIGYQRISTGDVFVFTWSFCSSKYSSDASVQSTMEVDYHGLVNKILLKLYESDKTTLRAAFMSSFGAQYTIEEFSQRFTGRCANLPPIPPSFGYTIHINVTSTGGYSRRLTEDLFYDHEDGTTTSLTLMLTNEQRQVVRIDSFVNLDITENMLYVAMRRLQRTQSVERWYRYLLIARDSGGKQGTIIIMIRRLQYTIYPSPFTFTFYYATSSAASTTVYAKHVDQLITSIATYYQLSSRTSVMVLDYLRGDGGSTTRILLWRPYEEQTCASAILQRTRAARTSSGDITASLLQAFPTSLSLTRIFINTTCDDPTTPPTPIDPIDPLVVPFCSIFSYALSLTTFIDQIDGNIKNLHLELLDASSNAITSTSPLRLNQATLELYTVGSTAWYSSTSSMQFNLRATNGAGLSSQTSVSVRLSGAPYTSDCPCTSSFTRSQTAATGVADIDVAIQFVNRLKSYYGDSSIQMKLLQFVQTSSYGYSVSWSNCSFSYTTQQEANYGLQESDRTAIDAIFTLLVNNDGSVNSNMVSSFASEFDVSAVNTSYNCIETPPEPETLQTIILAPACRTFTDPISKTLFIDKQDGDARHLKLELLELAGTPLPLNSWVWFNDVTQVVYGVVTLAVRSKLPEAGSEGYKYMLRATDKSGRTANLTYIIRMGSPLPVMEIRFLMGFSNNQAVSTPTATFLSNITSLLANYLNINSFDSQVFVREYNLASYMVWSMCSFTCTQDAKTNLLAILQQSANSQLPSPSLVAALKPHFTVTSIRNQEDACDKTSDLFIFTTIIVRFNASICGWYNLPLPDNAFTDNTGRVTSQFLVEMFFSFGLALPSTWITQYNQAEQRVYGVPVGDQLSQQYTFKLVASTIPAQYNATTTLQLMFPDFPLIRSVICAINFELEIAFNQDYTDMVVLIDILQKLASFLDVSVQQLHVINYSRTSSRLTVQWTNCTFFYMLEQGQVSSYYRYTAVLIDRVFSVYTTSSVVVRAELFNVFSPQAVLLSASTNGNCSLPPPAPPVANGSIIINASNCGLFYHSVSEYAFYNNDGTNARTMLLELVNLDNTKLTRTSWMSIGINQVIYGTPTYERQVSQPTGGYVFRLRATNKQGLTATTQVTVMLHGSVAYNPVISLSVTSTIANWNQTTNHHVIIPFFRKMASYMSDSLVKLRLIGDVSYVSETKSLTVTFANCSNCDLKTNLRLLDIETDTSFSSSFLPNFAVVSRSLLTSTLDQSECDSTEEEGKLQVNVSFCMRTQVDGFTLVETQYQASSLYYLTVLSADMTPLPLDAPLLLDRTSWTLSIVPTVKARQEQSSQGAVYQLALLTQATNQPLAFTQLTLFIKNEPPPARITFSLTMRTSLSSTNQDMVFINAIWDALSTYLSVSDMAYVSFTRTSVTPFIFKYIYSNCSLPADCEHEDYKRLKDLLFDNSGAVRQEIVALFPATYTIEDFTTECNSVPPTKPPDLNITISSCGLFRYQLPADFSTDLDDGNLYSMTVVLRNMDGSTVGRESWIQFYSSTFEIVAMAPESIVQSYLAGNRIRYMIIVRDSDGNEVSSIVHISLTSITVSYFRVAISFQSLVVSTTSYVDIQRLLLQETSRYLGYSDTMVTSLSSYRVNSFSLASASSESYYIKFTNCSTRERLCADEDTVMQRISSLLITSTGEVRQEFASFVAASFRVTSVNIESQYKRDSPPTVVTPISTITMTTCSMVVRNVSAGTFYDVEDGDTFHLRLEHLTTIGQLVVSSYWTQLVNYRLYFVANDNTQLGQHTTVLRATDKCNQSATTNVNVILSSTTSIAYGYRVTMEMSISGSFPDVYYLEAIMTTIHRYFRSSVYTLTVLSYTRTTSSLTLTWANCSITTENCNHTVLNYMSSLMVSSMGDIHQAFQTAFSSIAVITTITEWRSNDCFNPPNRPVPERLVIPLDVPICSPFEYTIPATTFTDPEDGNTRNLLLSLYDADFAAVTLSSWLQLNTTSQMIYGYVRFTPGSVLVRQHTFILQARDKDLGTAVIRIKVTIVGNLPADNYKMTVRSRNNLPSPLPDIVVEIAFVRKLQSYFDTQAISNIALVRDPRFPFVVTYEFGLCEMRAEPCDCLHIAALQPKVTSLSSFQQHMRQEFEVESITEVLSRSCLTTSPPQIVRNLGVITAVQGRVFSRTLQGDTFFDLEDGGTKNLTLIIRDSQGKVTEAVEWMSVSTSQMRLCGVLSMYVYSQMLIQQSTTRYEYQLVARDACGKEAINSFLVEVTSVSITLNYKIFVIIHGFYGDYIGNCDTIQFVVDTISSFGGIVKDRLYVDRVASYNASANATSIVVGITDCTNATIAIIRQRLFLQSGSPQPGLTEELQKLLTVIDLTDALYPCDHTTPIPPPSPPDDDSSFPWWWVIIILILLALILFFWLLWLSIPRCCPTCCATWFPCCFACCLGKYSSLSKTSKEEEESESFEEVSIVSDGSQEEVTDPDYKADRKHLKQDVIGGGESDTTKQTGAGGKWGLGSSDGMSIDSGMGQSDRFSGRDDVFIGPPPPLLPPGYSRSSSKRSSVNEERYFSDRESHRGDQEWLNRDSRRRRSYDDLEDDFRLVEQGRSSRSSRRSNDMQQRRSSYESIDDTRDKFTSLPDPHVSRRSSVRITHYHDPRSMATFGHLSREQPLRVSVRQPVSLTIPKEAISRSFESDTYQRHGDVSSSRRSRSSRRNDISLQVDRPIRLHGNTKQRSVDALVDRPIIVDTSPSRLWSERRSKSAESSRARRHHRSEEGSFVISPRSINLRLSGQPVVSQRRTREESSRDTSMTVHIDERDLGRILSSGNVRLAERRQLPSTESDSPSSGSVDGRRQETQTRSSYRSSRSRNKRSEAISRGGREQQRRERSYELDSRGRQRRYRLNDGYESDSYV